MKFVARSSRRFRIFATLSMFALLLQGCEEPSQVEPTDSGERANEVVERIEALLESHGAGAVSYGPATYDPVNDKVTIDDFVVDKSENDDNGKMSVERIVVTNPETPEDGTFSAMSVEMYDGTGTGKDDETISFEKVTELDVYVPSREIADKESEVVAYTMAREVVIENMVLGPKPTVPISRIHYSRGKLVEKIPISIAISLEGISIPVDELEEEEQKKALRDLGYENLDLDVTLDWTWDSTTNDSAFGPIKVSVTDVGGYEIHTNLGGITRQLLLATDSDDALEQAQQITLKSLKFTYTDDSAIGRTLALAAKKLGVDTEAVIDIWLGEVQRSLAAAETPEPFNDMVIAAMTKFLNNPNKLSVSVNPPQPLPAAQIVGSVMFGAAALVPMLNISVKAE